MATEAKRRGMSPTMADMLVTIAEWPLDGGINDPCRMDFDARTMAALDRRKLVTPEFDVRLTEIGRAVADAIRAEWGEGNAL